MKIWGFGRECLYAFEVVAKSQQMKVVREKVSYKWKSKELYRVLNQRAETSKLSGLSNRTFTLSNGKFNTELQKRANCADHSVLFFLAGANFWEKHAKNY